MVGKGSTAEQGIAERRILLGDVAGVTIFVIETCIDAVPPPPPLRDQWLHQRRGRWWRPFHLGWSDMSKSVSRWTAYASCSSCFCGETTGTGRRWQMQDSAHMTFCGIAHMNSLLPPPRSSSSLVSPSTASHRWSNSNRHHSIFRTWASMASNEFTGREKNRAALPSLEASVRYWSNEQKISSVSLLKPLLFCTNIWIGWFRVLRCCAYVNASAPNLQIDWFRNGYASASIASVWCWWILLAMRMHRPRARMRSLARSSLMWHVALSPFTRLMVDATDETKALGESKEEDTILSSSHIGFPGGKLKKKTAQEGKEIRGRVVEEMKTNKCTNKNGWSTRVVGFGSHRSWFEK